MNGTYILFILLFFKFLNNFNNLKKKLKVVAQNIEILITIKDKEINNYEIVKLSSCLKHQKCSNEKEQKMLIYAGDLYAKEQRDILFVLKCKKLNSPANPPIDDIIGTKITYFDVNESILKEKIIFLKMERDVTENNNNINIDIDKQKNRLIMVKALEQSEKIAKTNLEEGRKVYFFLIYNTTFF